MTQWYSKLITRNLSWKNPANLGLAGTRTNILCVLYPPPCRSRVETQLSIQHQHQVHIYISLRLSLIMLASSAGNRHGRDRHSTSSSTPSFLILCWSLGIHRIHSERRYQVEYIDIPHSILTFFRFIFYNVDTFGVGYNWYFYLHRHFQLYLLE